MAAPGDSLLLRSGLVRAELLAEAQRLRARGGGTVGEWLVRLGAVTEEQLVDFYHRRLLVPCVTSEQLLHVAPEALAAVPVDMASEFRVFPVSIDAGKALTLAMADPSDAHVAEEVAFYSGRVCRRAVASVSAIHDAIERHYRPRGGAQVPRPAPAPGQPAPAASSVDGYRSLRTEPYRIVPLPDEPSVPLTVIKDEPPSVAQPDDDSAVPTPVAKETSASRRLRSITLSRIAAAPRDVTSMVDPRAESRAEEPIPLAKPAFQGQRSRSRTLPGIALVAEQLPVDLFRRAQSRDDVAAALLSYASQLAPVTALLVMRKGILVGLDARGDVDLAAVRRIAVSLAEPSLFRDVVQSRLPYRGPLPEGPVHRAVLDVLGRHTGESLLLPILVMERVIGVLYGAGIVTSLPDASLHEVGREAGLAYERLIRTSRQ